MRRPRESSKDSAVTWARCGEAGWGGVESGGRADCCPRGGSSRGEGAGRSGCVARAGRGDG
eukprot:33783-Eustigmatos_ZCMA.PRE.1